jgi:putative methyltransferase (TIGR04325 family)
VDIKSRVIEGVKARIVRNVGPIRRMVERIESLEGQLASSAAEILRLKRMLNLVGDQHKLFHDYAAAFAECVTAEGYDDGDLSRYLVAKSAVALERAGTGPIEVSDHLAQSLLVTLAVAHKKKSLSVIDFGGGCAIPMLILKDLLGADVAAQWHVVELPSLVEAARERLAIPHVTFSASIEESVAQLGTVDLVHTAGTLQYVDDPRTWLSRLLAIRAAYLFVGRAAFHDGTADVIGIQHSRIRDHGMQIDIPDQPEGDIEYPFTYMPKADFDRLVAAAGYELVASFDSWSGFRPINEHRITGGAFFYRYKGTV